MSRDIRFMHLALNIAELSTHNFRMGAIITYKSQIVSFGVNKYKTHPLQKNHYTNELGRSIHAELSAILKAPVNKRRGSKIYIARLLSDGSTGNAKPCRFCRDLLLASDIYIAVYSISGNKFIKEDLREQKKLEESSF